MLACFIKSTQLITTLPVQQPKNQSNPNWQNNGNPSKHTMQDNAFIQSTSMNETYTINIHVCNTKKIEEKIYLQESSRKSGGRRRAWNWAMRKQWLREMEALIQHRSSSQQETFIHKIRLLLCDSFKLIWKWRVEIGMTWKCGEIVASGWRCPRRRKCVLVWTWLLRWVSPPRFGRPWSGKRTWLLRRPSLGQWFWELGVFLGIWVLAFRSLGVSLGCKSSGFERVIICWPKLNISNSFIYSRSNPRFNSSQIDIHFSNIGFKPG